MGLSARVCKVGDVAEQNALKIVSGCAPEASACDTAGASAVIRIASNPMRLPNLRTRRRRMRLTLTSKAMEPSIMPCADGGICVLALQLLRPIAAHEISLQGAGKVRGVIRFRHAKTTFTTFGSEMKKARRTGLLTFNLWLRG